MKKILFSIIVALLMPMFASAQSSMTDAQIIDFVQKEQKAGSSQSQIVTKLMQKGVTVDRLREVRKKYEKMGGQSTQGAKDLTSGGNNRTRNALADASNAEGQKSVPYRLKDGNMQTMYDERSTQWNDLHTELDGFMPDSTALFDQQMEEMFRNQRKVFGRDIFNNKSLSFEPNMNIATPQNYVLGPGDQVFVDIYGASQKSVDATVTPDGFIHIEGYGPVQVSGLTLSQATSRLRSTVGQRFVGSNIKLSLGETRAIMVNVMGEVRVPGTYTLSAFSSVFHALYMAGGVSDIGTLRDIKVYRKNKLVSSVDIYDYILNGKLTGNVKLADNDVIVVGPYDCMVNVTGKVKRPMFYEMKKGESLGTLMKYAGGFTGDAYKNSIRVTRKAGKEYSVWNVTEFDMNDFQLNDEDSVAVDSVVARYHNAVELRGAVDRPGMYQIGEKVTTVRELINLADGLKEEAFTDHVILHRARKDHSLEVIALNLTDIMSGKVADVPLQNEDVLFIPSTEEQNKNLTLQIFGEVYYPGQYQFAEGMTVEDFILQAGGLKESASKKKVTISRRVALTGSESASGNQVQERGMRAQTFDIDLKEGFVLDGKEGFKLQPFDEVYVGKIPGYGEQLRIEIDGEVNFRGTYALSKNNARLSDVIAQAGGLTNDAWAKGAKIVRKMTEEEIALRDQQGIDLRVYNDMIISSTNANVDRVRKDLVDSLLNEKYVDVEAYELGVYLDKALKNPGGKYDVTLRDGDKLIIPQYDPTVKVSGEVNMPGSTTFIPGKKAKFYINRAGGYSGTGWKHHAYVKYANGEVKRVGRGATIEPGCEVIAPVKPVRVTNNSTIWISAMSSIATIAAVLVSALK